MTHPYRTAAPPHDPTPPRWRTRIVVDWDSLITAVIVWSGAAAMAVIIGFPGWAAVTCLAVGLAAFGPECVCAYRVRTEPAAESGGPR
jgi:hypothetical protein